MKISKRILVVCLLLATLLSGTTLLRVAADSTPMTDQQVELIRDNCVSNKNTLDQLHASDALLRVNLGQTYESMSTKLMEAFNSRVSNNSFSNTNLVSVTNSYDSAIDTFRSDYITYEQQLSSAININCLDQPVPFYDSVASARTKRDQVHTDVVKLNQYIDQYQSAVNQFENDYNVAAGGVKQ